MNYRNGFFIKCVLGVTERVLFILCSKIGKSQIGLHLCQKDKFFRTNRCLFQLAGVVVNYSVTREAYGDTYFRILRVNIKRYRP